MSYLDLKQALGITETKILVLDQLVRLSKRVGGKLTTKDLEELKEGLTLYAQKEETALLREKLT